MKVAATVACAVGAQDMGHTSAWLPASARCPEEQVAMMHLHMQMALAAQLLLRSHATALMHPVPALTHGLPLTPTMQCLPETHAFCKAIEH